MPNVKKKLFRIPSRSPTIFTPLLHDNPHQHYYRSRQSRSISSIPEDSKPGMSSSLPSPSLSTSTPSPYPSIRPSKLELLRLLREQREQQLQAASTQPTPSLASTSDANTLPPNSAASTSSDSKVNMGAILGGLAGGLFVLALILVAIIVPLQRRRRLRSALTSGVAGGEAAKSRRRIKLDLPFGLGGRGDAEKGSDDQEDKERESMIAGKTYPTARTHRTTGSQAPLLGGDRVESAPSSPTRQAFGERGDSIRLEEPREAMYPVQSSTQLYQEQRPASGTPVNGAQSSRRTHEQEQKQPGNKHDNLWFYYRTNSTAAPPISNSSTVKNGAVPEFDPYSPFEGTRSPLEGRFPETTQSSGGAVELERPAPAAAPSSPKKQTRDLPLPETTPFVEVDLNDTTTSNAAGLGTVNSRHFGTGKSSVDIYTCIDNPFMTSSERNQAKPPANGGAVGQTAEGGKAGGASWFSYHSSSVRSGPNSRAPPLPPTFIPTSSAAINARNPTHQDSLDSVSDTDSESMYSQMSLSRSTTAMSVNGSIIRYGSARAQVAGNGGSGFMPVVHEGKEDPPIALKVASVPVSEDADTDALEPPSPSSTKDGDDPIPNDSPAVPATSASNNGASLNRLDTLAIGNLLKTRANKVAVERSDSVVEKIERKGSIWEIGSNAGVRRQDSKRRNEEVVVRGRGVRRGEAEEGGEHGRIARAPVKRTKSTSMEQNRGQSRSQSRGRLVPKASAQRLRGASSDNEGGVSGGSEEGGISPAKPPIGRSPSKYKPKGLQQRPVEKGLLNAAAAGGRSRSASRDVKERVRAPVEVGDDELEQNTLAREEDDASSAASTPSPSPAQGKLKNDRNPPIRKAPPSNLDSSLLSAPPEHTKVSDAVEGFAGNPLTGAFGLDQSPSARSPATPTFHYASAELESAKGFLPKVEGLKVGGSPGKKKTGK